MIDSLNCDLCQRNKLDGKGCGFLPEHEVHSIPFEEYTMDLIGPWKVPVRGKPHRFEAFDVPVQNPKSKSQVKILSQDSKPKTQVIIVICMFVCLILSQFQDGEWLPEVSHQRCVHCSQQISIYCNCKKHQTIGNILKTKTRGHIAKHMGTCCQYKIYGDRLLIQKNIYGTSLITMHGMRAGVYSTLGSSPGNLVFNRDMFLNIPLIADWHKDKHI